MKKPPAPIAITHISPGKLKAAPYNPRILGEIGKAKLRRSLETFGMVDPIIARKKDRLVLGGHQRLELAKEMGFPTVPVVFLDDIDDQKAAALNVVLNNPNAQGGWDYDKLANLLSELDGNGFDATVTGFDDDFLRRLLGDGFGGGGLEKSSKSKEVNVAGMDLKHECPRCGFEFEDPAE